MKTKAKFRLSAALLVMPTLFFLLTNCMYDDVTTKPVVTTNEVTEVTETTAISGGEIISDGGSKILARGVCWSTNLTQTIADSKTIDGLESGSFISVITGLTPNTTYYVRAYATSKKGTSYGSAMSLRTNIAYGSVTDIDGNIYKTVTIGTQTWMAENLKVARYNDGAVIPNVTSATQWKELTTGALCDYMNTPSNSEIYGKLYNWYAVNTGRLSPQGWRVPNNSDWNTLRDYLGGDAAGGKLKETGTTHWASPNVGATNETGFTALPGSLRTRDGGFWPIGTEGSWWSATHTGYNQWGAYYWGLNSDSPYFYDSNANCNFGLSIRCIKN